MMKKKNRGGWLWWDRPGIPAYRRMRQEDGKIETSLGSLDMH